MEKVILWGTGKIAQKLLPVINDTILLVVDNDRKKWGMMWNGYMINNPSAITNYYGNFDRIIIAMLSWKKVRKQILEEFAIESDLIDNMYYRQRKLLLDSYKPDMSFEEKKYISYLKRHPLEVFNDEFTIKYEYLNPDVYFDREKLLYYVFHKNKKMYFSSAFTTEEQVRTYYSFLLMEQDNASPHRYLTDCFHVSRHDIVLDAGVAEGNFALEIVDLADKLYLVECDKEWIKALRYTFEPYKDKVKIIEGALGNGCRGSRSVDEIIGGDRVDFIKMDIEGAEWEALCGASQSLKQNDVKLDICVYHNADDEEKIERLLGEKGYETEASDGYMVFITEQFLQRETVFPKLVRGLVRGRKKGKKLCGI